MFKKSIQDEKMPLMKKIGEYGSNDIENSVETLPFLNRPHVWIMVAFILTVLISYVILFIDNSPSVNQNSGNNSQGDDCLKSAHCYSFGSGSQQTSKNTWAVSDPVKAAMFMIQYLPVTAWMVGSYDDIIDGDDGQFSTDKCFVTGKVFLGNSKDKTFQLHAVNTAADSRLGMRPTGILSLPQIEAKVSTLMEYGISSKQRVSFMDWNVGLWTSDLCYYFNTFLNGDIPFYTLKWPSTSKYGRSTSNTDESSDDDYYYSLMIQIPNTTMILEIMGEDPFTKSGKLKRSCSEFNVDEVSTLPRYAGSLPPDDFNVNYQFKKAPLKAVKVSYVTSSVSRDAAYYQNTLGATEVLALKSPVSEMSQENRRYFWFEGDNSNSVEIHLVESNDLHVDMENYYDKYEKNDLLQDIWAVSDYEAYVNQVHSEYMSSGHTSGSDVFLDNHYGRRLGSQQTLDSLVASLDTNEIIDDEVSDDNDNYYRLWQQTNENSSPVSVGYFVYAATPNGNSVQVVGSFDDVPEGIEEWSSCLV